MALDEPVRIDIRLSGQLKRYHTWPIIGQQTVAEHCWQILRIYLSVAETIDPHMVRHIVFHDIGETAIGDLPYPVKSENHDLKEKLEMLETQSNLQQLHYWDAFQMTLLSETDRGLFKQIELIEMAEFGLDQMNLGNSHAFIIADRCLRKVYENQPTNRLVKYVVKRINLFSQQYKYPIPSMKDWWSAKEWEALNDS